MEHIYIYIAVKIYRYIHAFKAQRLRIITGSVLLIN
jgi:hypothetical protein